MFTKWSGGGGHILVPTTTGHRHSRKGQLGVVVITVACNGKPESDNLTHPV